MNDSAAIDAYLLEFYGTESHWYVLILFTSSVLTILSNLLFFAITLTSKAIRSKSSIWLLVGFAASDFIFGLAANLESIAIWTGNRHMCSLAGAFITFSAACSASFPFLIAADRFYKITIPENTKFSLGIALFSDRFMIPLIICWYSVFAMGTSLPVLLNNGFGEDPGGYCAAKKFPNVRMLLAYLGTTINMVLLAQLFCGVYYFCLHKWLSNQQKIMVSEEGIRQTKEVMKFIKILFIPMVSSTPVAVLSGGQMLWPDLPMWLQRMISVPFITSSVVNPWLTIILMRPFRRRFLHLLSKVGIVPRKTPVERIMNAENVSEQKNTPIQRWSVATAAKPQLALPAEHRFRRATLSAKHSLT